MSHRSIITYKTESAVLIFFKGSPYQIIGELICNREYLKRRTSKTHLYDMLSLITYNFNYFEDMLHVRSIEKWYYGKF